MGRGQRGEDSIGSTPLRRRGNSAAIEDESLHQQFREIQQDVNKLISDSLTDRRGEYTVIDLPDNDDPEYTVIDVAEDGDTLIIDRPNSESQSDNDPEFTVIDVAEDGDTLIMDQPDSDDPEYTVIDLPDE